MDSEIEPHREYYQKTQSFSITKCGHSSVYWNVIHCALQLLYLLHIGYVWQPTWCNIISTIFQKV